MIQNKRHLLGYQKNRGLQKIAAFISALLIISFLTFLLIKLSSSDPAEAYLRASKIGITSDALAEARQFLGLNKPWWQQYFDWLSKAIRGDFGRSYLLKTPVLPLVLERFTATLYLGTVSFFIVCLLSIPLGIASGLFRKSLFAKVLRFFSFASVSLPSFFLGYLLILVFALKWQLLPVSGKEEQTSVILPSISLSLSLIGQYTELISKAISQQLSSLHVENAKLRGVKYTYIIRHHLIRNALPSIVTGLSLTFIYLLTGSLIVEEVFSWNGIGSLFVHSLQTLDLPVIQACMILFGSLYLLNNIFTEKLVLWVDPRLRNQEK
ncbi:ABC transporter permease [Streptococcus catagoni]|uniref:ABC transporter permease n=1 Tax=Streptococcus catagoni TaxID=2654874 RepID=UPI00140CA849|nr:ABC transporter permease [Streptococcus catagoni]